MIGKLESLRLPGPSTRRRKRGAGRAILGLSFIAILLVSSIGNAAFSVLKAAPQTQGREPLATAAVPRIINTQGLHGPVNPFIDIYSGYSQEPAPMGIADYGIGPSGAYQYSTNSSLGTVDLVTLSAKNSTGYPWISIQLNVNLQFTNGGRTSVYWVQDVAYLDTFNNSVFFIDNVWNSSTRGAGMRGGIQGNGVVARSGIQTYYYDVADASLSGNGVELVYPSLVQLRVNSTVNAAKQPIVTFEYNDGFGWEEYDSVDFAFVRQLTSMSGFVVNGFSYSPVNYYDSELILGGPGGGASTADLGSDVSLQLEYWNGHNYQVITNAYDFGSDTGETISNVLAQKGYNQVNGGVEAQIQSAAGSVGKIWDQSAVSILDLKTSIASGSSPSPTRPARQGRPGNIRSRTARSPSLCSPGL